MRDLAQQAVAEVKTMAQEARAKAQLRPFEAAALGPFGSLAYLRLCVFCLLDLFVCVLVCLFFLFSFPSRYETNFEGRLGFGGGFHL